MIKRDFTRKIEEFRNKSNQDKINFLSNFWEFPIQNEPFKLIGTYEKSDRPDKNGKEYGFFINVRNLNGDILYYPFNLGQVRIWVEHRENLLSQKFWQFDVEISKLIRIDKNPFQLNLANKIFGNPKNKFFDRIEKEKLIRKIFDETGSTQRDAKNLSNALKRIAGDLYTETERFVFELLQNADDIPNERGEVDVKFNLLLENLLFLHNGKPFDNNDVESISSIGDSTKRKDAEKTGYKGIGFKSVFTDAETVLINSGNFSFSFDKHSPLYETLYEGQNIEEIPWEIKPIWTEVYRYPKEVRNNEDFFKYPVAIDLEVGYEKITSYRQQISQLFSEPRFILFLRHIKSIEVQGLDNNIKIQKQKKNERFELLNNENPIDEWCIDDYDFSVSQEVRDAMANDKVVPEKLKEIQKSKLSFACQINDNGITSISPEKSFLFTYLPTNVNDYSFPFLVNADFLTTANRQSIHIKNTWNLFLFEQIGYLCFEWISKLSQTKELRNSITNLIPKYYENSNELIHLQFNKGFDKAISEIAFLPTYKIELTKVADAIVDLTGFTDIIGEKLFFGTQFAHKNLIVNELQNKESLSELEGITIFDTEELKKIIANSNFGELIDIKELLEIFNRNNELGIESCDIRDIIENANPDSINNWIENCDRKTYELFLGELENSKLRQKTKDRICSIKIFKFSNNKYYSFNEVISAKDSFGRTSFKFSDCFIKNKKIQNIAPELHKLGFVLSEKSISDFPMIFSSTTMPEDKKIYEKIALKCNTNTLIHQEKKKLFLNFINEETKFDGIAKETLKDLCLFSNDIGIIKPLCELVDNNSVTPNWINCHKIKAEENFAELKPYLISEEKEIFGKIILSNLNSIIPEIKGDIREIKAFIKCFTSNEKQFFKQYIIKKETNDFSIIPKTNDKYQITSPDSEARKFIDENCIHKLFVLPSEFLEYKDEEGIIKADDLHSLILECVNVNTHKESLVKIVHYKARYLLLQKLTEFIFDAEISYTKNDYEYKILELACDVYKEDKDFLNFNQKTFINIQANQAKLTDIQSVDKIEVSGLVLRLSLILPEYYKYSNWVSKIINRFVELGLPEDKLNRLFNIGTAPTSSTIYQSLLQYTVIQNDQQLAFLALYLHSNNIRNFNFARYQMTGKEKRHLFDCMYKTEIKNIDWIKFEQNLILQIFGFNPENSVYPNELACESELLPEYLILWIGIDENKIKFLSNLGVWVKGSTIVNLRKFWKGECSFDSSELSRELRFDTNKVNLSNSFEYLKSKNIQLTTKEQIEAFEKAIECKNKNCSSSYCFNIEKSYDFSTIMRHVSEWTDDNYENWKSKLNNKFLIYLFEGELPKTVKIRGRFENYIFYHYYEGNAAIDENKIYVNSNTNILDSLLALSSENKRLLSSDDLLPLIVAKNDTQIELENRIHLLEKQLCQLQQKPNAMIGAGISTDISKNDQIETNREAKEVVKERLENEGYEFIQGVGEYSTIEGVKKDGVLYPLVVKSYKYADEPFKIGINEWIQLMRPNAMFWVHFGNRKLGCLRLFDLLRKEDKLSISFSTENLDVENRLNKFANLLHYFKEVHIEFNNLMSNKYTAENLNDYRFDERKSEDDLSSDDSSML